MSQHIAKRDAKKIYKVYKITCTVTNKVYIGQTYTSLKTRFNRHKEHSRYQNFKLYRAMRKYGFDKFKIELIEIVKNQKELDEREFYWIQKYNAVKNGYNMKNSIGKVGGDTLTGHENLDEIRKKISEKVSGKNNHKARAVKCKNIETNEELFFDTFQECKKYFNQSQHNFISRRCSGENKTLFEGKWLIAYKENNYIENYKITNSPSHYTKIKYIKVYDMKNKKTKKFKTLKEIDDYYGFVKNYTSNRRSKLKRPLKFTIKERYNIEIIEE